MQPIYGDIVKIDGNFYLYLEDGYHDINGGGVLANNPPSAEIELNIGIVLNSYLNSKIGQTEQKLEQVKTVLE